MYSAFEQALSMKRALYKFGIIIIALTPIVRKLTHYQVTLSWYKISVIHDDDDHDN